MRPLLARFFAKIQLLLVPASKPKTKPSAMQDDASPEAAEVESMLESLLAEILTKAGGTTFAKLPAYQEARTRDAAYRGRLVLALATALHRCPEENYQFRLSMGVLLGMLLEGNPSLDEADYLRLFRLYGLDFSANAAPERYFGPIPVVITLAQVHRLVKKQGHMGEPMLTFLMRLLSHTTGHAGDAGKISLKVQEILRQTGEGKKLPTVLFANRDAFGRQLNAFVAGLAPAAPYAQRWLQLLGWWQKAAGARPTAKFRTEMAAAIAAIGPDAVRQQARTWLALLGTMPVRGQSRALADNGDRPRNYSNVDFLHETNVAVAKGLIWAVQPLADEPLLHLLANLAVKCYGKIPGKGAVAAGLGNACLHTLAHNGLPGVAALARVRSRIKQSNTQDLIAGYIDQASRALGVSTAEIEDLAVPDFDLKEGRAETAFDDYTATLILANGKAEVQWANAGKPRKTVPTALKATHADELKGLKAALAQVQQTYTAQRDRLDRSFVTGRRIAWPWFEQHYFNHGLLGELVRPLIWRQHCPDGTSWQDALWLDNQWRGAHGQPLPAPAAEAEFQLWHPVLAPAAEVLAWRALLEKHQLRQPLRQAFREVYLLTPPEERTATYSNRMAAHILKQHQFSALARLRGWKYRLMGAYDKGYNSDQATLELPAHGLRAEFWVSEVNTDGAYNDSGIWDYVSTDQVRFARGSEPVPLPDIAPLVFSEVMRDADLFVGVASVGNDPQWRDNGGLTQYRNYWESYSFGELGEVAKNRRLALERLVPRLKIGKVSEIRDKFLVVRGKVRTYKIHLGSGNILMEPNDQYLCIVPDRSVKTVGTADVFLPFEGDAVLSIILSKALLLMDDDKIRDETILRQIR